MGLSYGESEIIVGDCREELAKLPEQHFHCCVTSPPYFGLRDYGHDGQIGLETTPDDFVEAMVATFAEVWRVLRDDGVLWLNLGDSYTGNASSGGKGKSVDYCERKLPDKITPGLKPKDLIGIPWRVAFALQSAGWYLRDAVIWHKPAPMPGSQRDRCTSAYEYIFQLTKKPRYYFDLEAVKEGASSGVVSTNLNGKFDRTAGNSNGMGASTIRGCDGSRTPRNVWKIAHEGFNEAHFATFPREIPTRCIKASTSEKGCCPACGAPWERITDRDRKATRLGKTNVSDDTGKANRDEQRHVTTTRTVGWQPSCSCGCCCGGRFVSQEVAPARVLDCFNGAGTTGIAANMLGRDYTGIELNPEYADMARNRIARELRPSTAVNMNAEPEGLFAN